MGTIDQILNAPTPSRRGALRNSGLSRKEWAVEIRKLLKELGIKGVSVKTPRYSMAQSVDLKVPADEYHECVRSFYHPERRCPTCDMRHEARARLRLLILAAYPDMRDRSDYQSDYFDNPLHVF